MDSDDIKVLLSILLIWAVVIATCVFAARRDKRAPADDIGVMWLVALAMYGTLPPLSWLLQGSSYGLLSVHRLFMLQPTSAEIVQLMYLGIAYACGFAGVYLFLRRYVPRPHSYTHAPIKGPQITAALLFVLVYLALTTALRAGGYLRSAESYVDSYSAVQELPLGLRQILRIAAGIANIAQLVLLVALLQRWPRTRKLFILYIVMLLLTYDPSGSRKAVALGLLSAAIGWHILIRPIAARRWVTAGTVGFVVFTILGVLRGIGIWGGDTGDFEAGDFEGIGLGELDSLWANSLHLLQEGHSKLDIPWAARYGEFWAFIPSQMLPFGKLTLQDWYLDTFFPEYKEQGGGWEFGALTQAVIGGGVVEALLRGSAIAVLSIGLMKWYRSSTATAWWRLPLYLHLLTIAFLSIRGTTFGPLAEFVQIGVPALFLIELTATLVAQMSPSTRTTDPKLPNTQNA